MIGRMMSPDNYVHDGMGTQGYNRYSYVYNNPLKYNDPDGQLGHIAVGAIIGAVANIGIGFWTGEIHDLQDFVVYGVTGAGIGALAAATAGASLAATGLSAATLGGGALSGAAAGAVSGLQGGVNGVYQLARYEKGSWKEIGRTTAYGVLIGAASGAVVGGAIGGYRQWKNPNTPASVETNPKFIDPTPSPTPSPNIAERSDNFVGPRNPATQGYSIEVEDLLFNGVGNTPEGAVNAWGYRNGDIYGAVKTSTKLLNQFNSAESLIQGAGNLTKVNAGMQGFIKGDGNSIFKAITNGSIGTTSRGGIIMPGNTTIFNHFSTKTGIYTIDINKAGQMFKIRITP
jgi:hypothetical protein